MILFLLAILIVAFVAAAVQAIVRDDRGHLAPPSSHSVDPAFLPPASLFTRR